METAPLAKTAPRRGTFHTRFGHLLYAVTDENSVHISTIDPPGICVNRVWLHLSLHLYRRECDGVVTWKVADHTSLYVSRAGDPTYSGTPSQKRQILEVVPANWKEFIEKNPWTRREAEREALELEISVMEEKIGTAEWEVNELKEKCQTLRDKLNKEIDLIRSCTLGSLRRSSGKL